MKSIVENRDCMEAMREFPDKFFELAVVEVLGKFVWSMYLVKKRT